MICYTMECLASSKGPQNGLQPLCRFRHASPNLFAPGAELGKSTGNRLPRPHHMVLTNDTLKGQALIRLDKDGFLETYQQVQVN